MVTKYRRKCITAPMLTRLQEILAATTAKWGGELIECHGAADHVHLLISLSPTVQVSTFVNNLKTVSSRLIREECGRDLSRWYRKPVFWNRSYCVISGGGAPLSVLRQYIEQQPAVQGKTPRASPEAPLHPPPHLRLWREHCGANFGRDC